MYKDDSYSYFLDVFGTEEEQQKVYELLCSQSNIIGNYLEPCGDKDAPFAQYACPEQHGVSYEWTESDHEQLLHSIALQLPNITLELSGQNEDDKSYGFQKRFHGNLYQEHKLHSIMPPFRAGLDIPFQTRYNTQPNASTIEGALLINEICLERSNADQVLMLAHLFRNRDLNNVPIGQLLELTQRVNDLFMREDDSRFTREDILDALTDMYHLDALPTVLTLSDEDFDRLAICAAEEFRERMSRDNVEETMTFHEILEKAKRSKYPSLSSQIMDSQRPQANQMPGIHHPRDYGPEY